MAEKLFDEKTLRKLEQLRLVANRVRAGAIKGERRSTRRGTSVEFADYRNYTRGDDLRRLDWNIYARLERPFIKLLEEEEDLSVQILFDASGSMDWPDLNSGAGRDTHKFTYGQRLAAGLGHIALTTGDHLTVVGLRADGPQVWGPMRGRGRTLALLDFLEDVRPGGLTDLSAALRDWSLRMARPGLVLIVSDLLSPTGFETGLDALLGRGAEVAVIHILAPDETNPPLAGDLSLVDTETRHQQDVTIDAPMRELYAQRFLAWREQIGAFCAGRGVHYLMVETSVPWEELILFDLRRLQVVK
ncbi:MAG: DUF58 domain-containing protein [Anaerolineae bacterium]|nr:DUF58 domain-containing protein [Anaerolineae bacterium]